MSKIAIIIPTIHRDDTLMETLSSILDVLQDNWHVYIIDQNKEKNYSDEKRIFYEIACSQFHSEKEARIKVLKTEYNIGLSKSRNLGVEQAKKDNIPYCLISADSIKFTESMKLLSYLPKYLNYSDKFNIDLLGLNLKNRTVGWEAWLDKKDSFILDFIDKNNENERFVDLDSLHLSEEWVDEKNNPILEGSVIKIWNCDIVRNFFLATTKSLFEVKWDNNLKMMEHEDFFWRYKQARYKVGWTNLTEGLYIGKKEDEYYNLRRKNINESRKYLFEKYNLKNWITYKNLERAKEQAD